MYQVSTSQESHPEELELFTTPPTQGAYEKIQWVDYRPVAQIKEDAPVEFVIPASGSQYLNLKQTYLHIKAKLVQEDGSDLTLEDRVAPVNNMIHSLWDQVDVLFQQKLISSSTKNYQYKSMMETLLTYDAGAKNTQLQSAGFFKDTAGLMDAADPVTGGNSGLAKRYNLMLQSRVCDLMSPLHADLFQQNRLLLNGVEVQVKLWPARSTFTLMSPAKDKTYKIIITEAILKVCKINLSPSVSLAHAEMLSQTPAKYPFERSDIKTFNIMAGSFSFHAEDLYQGAVPSRLILGLVKSSAYNGSYGLNPYNFIHANCNSIGVYLDDESLPAQPLKPNFDQMNYITAYHTLFTALNKDGRDEGNDIARGEYDRGYTLFVFEILPTLSTMTGEMQQFPLIRRGNLKVNLSFQQALDENVTLIALGKFPDMVQIDNTRNIVV